MSLKHEFDRLAHLFDDGVAKSEKQTGQWLHEGSRRANELTRRVREQVDCGRRNAVTFEESIVRHMRENPAMYIIGASLLIGALIAKLVLETRRPAPPLL